MIDERIDDYPEPQCERLSVGACLVLMLTVSAFLWIVGEIAVVALRRAIF